MKIGEWKVQENQTIALIGWSCCLVLWRVVCVPLCTIGNFDNLLTWWDYFNSAACWLHPSLCRLRIDPHQRPSLLKITTLGNISFSTCEPSAFNNNNVFVTKHSKGKSSGPRGLPPSAEAQQFGPWLPTTFHWSRSARASRGFCQQCLLTPLKIRSSHRPRWRTRNLNYLLLQRPIKTIY